MEQFNYINYLLFPAIVAILSGIAAAFFSYKATYALRKKTLDEEKKLKKAELAETLRLEINKLNLTFEKLKEDVEIFNFFSLKNIPIATASTNRLKTLQERIILFDDEDIRREITEVTDMASSLADDLFVMENYQVNEENRLKEKNVQAEKEFRQFKLNLLTFGIYMLNGKAHYLKESKAKKKKNAEDDPTLLIIEGIFQNLISDIDTSSLNKLKADNEKKRILLVTRILDAQTKLRELQSNLRTY